MGISREFVTLHLKIIYCTVIHTLEIEGVFAACMLYAWQYPHTKVKKNLTELPNYQHYYQFHAMLS